MLEILQILQLQVRPSEISINGNSTSLIIPNEFARELQIENSKVSMSLIKDLDGDNHLLISKVYREIVID